MIATLLLLATPFAPMTQEFTVDGLKRTALVYAPSVASEKAPLVFAFHGHGGNSRNSARKFDFQTEWPEAVVIYPQGLTGVKGKTDPEGVKSGWQKAPGELGDRDVHFVDAMLDWVKKNYKIDEKRIFATGHSNGSAFTWVTMATRGDKFAAFAGACGGGGFYMRNAAKKPIMVIGGTKDEIVSIESIELFIKAMVKRQECGEGKTLEKNITLYPGSNPVLTYIYPGSHAMPSDAGKRIAKFFQEVK